MERNVKLQNLNNELVIEMLSEGDTTSIMQSIRKMNININKTMSGARIQPQLTQGDVDRATIKRILKLVTPAELEIIVSQFLGQYGLKVTKGKTAV